MKIHILQHVAFEGPGCIADWAKKGGHSLSCTRFFEQAFSFPEADAFDMLVIMGGPMGVHDCIEYPWLEQEKAFIQRSISQGKYVLGICLGAQLMAQALGAQVTTNAHPEIGWFPIVWHDQVRGHPLLYGLSNVQTMFHWHADRFDLPTGALLLARSEACDHQAFLHGARALGLQFHLEITEEGIEDLLQHGAHALRHPDKYTQTAEAIRARYKQLPSLHAIMFRLLDGLTADSVPARVKQSIS